MYLFFSDIARPRQVDNPTYKDEDTYDLFYLLVLTMDVGIGMVIGELNSTFSLHKWEYSWDFVLLFILQVMYFSFFGIQEKKNRTGTKLWGKEPQSLQVMYDDSTLALTTQK